MSHDRDDTDQPTPPDRRNDPTKRDDRPADPDLGTGNLPPTHPTDAELAQREQDRALESGEESPS